MPSNGFLIKALLVHDMLKTKKYIYSYIFNDPQCGLLQVVDNTCIIFSARLLIFQDSAVCNTGSFDCIRNLGILGYASSAVLIYITIALIWSERVLRC